MLKFLEDNMENGDGVKFFNLKEINQDFLKQIGCDPDKCTLEVLCLNDGKTKLTYSGTISELKKVFDYYCNKPEYHLEEQRYSSADPKLNYLIYTQKSYHKEEK